MRADNIAHDDATLLQAAVMQKTFHAADIMYALRRPSGGTVLPLIPSYHNNAIGKKIGIMPEADRIVASVNLHRN